MGLRGPPPTPTKTLDLRGSWRAKINSEEPHPEPGKPTCPKRLNKAQRLVWGALTDSLNRMGVLSKADGRQLERYSVFFVRWRECEDFVAINGVTYPMKSDNPTCYVGKLPDGSAVVGFVEYPQVRESHRLDKALKQIEASFGLTPSARARLKCIGEPEADDGPRLADFVG